MPIDYSQFTKTDTGNLGPDGKPVYDIFNQGTKLSYENALPLFKSGLNVDQIKPTSPISLPPRLAQDNAAGAIVAGAGAYMKELDTFLNPPSTDKTREETLTGELDKYLGESGGRGEAQLKQEEELGVPEAKKALASVQGDIKRKIAEYNALLVKNESQPILGSIVQGQQSNIAKFAAADIGILQAQASALQGNLETAQESANRAIDLRFQDQTDKINTKLKQLELIRSKLSGSEKTRSLALELSLNDQKDKLNTQVANERDKNSTLLNLLQNYPDAGITLKDTLESAANKVATRSRLYADRLSTGSGTVTERNQEKVKLGISAARTALEQSKKGGEFIDGNEFRRLRQEFAEYYGDTGPFDDVFVPELSPVDRAKYGLGKAAGLKADTTGGTNFDDL